MDIQAPKRTACDRCREQKLKCPRNQPPETPCDRCIRLGAVCTTSKARPLGRPRLNTISHDGRRVHGQQSPLAQQRSGASLAGDVNLSSISNPPSSPSLFSSSTSLQSIATPNLFSSDADGDVLVTQFEDFNAITAIDPSLVFPWSQPWLFPDSSIASTLDLVDQKDGRGANNHDSQGVVQDAGLSNPPSSEASTRSASLDGDPTAPLFGVMRSISRRLAELKDQAWSPSLMLLKLFDGRDPDFSNPGNLNPLEDTMCISMKFILVLQMMTPLNRSGASQPPTLSLSLMLFSSYLQLCQLFEAILTEIHESLLGTAPRLERSSPKLENGRRSSIQPEGPHIKMMIQCIEHQLSSAESLMRLPVRYRLWSQEATNGAADDDKPFPFNDAGMSQAEDVFKSLKGIIEEMQNILMG